MNSITGDLNSHIRSNQASRNTNTYLNINKNFVADLRTTPEKSTSAFNNLSLEYKLNQLKMKSNNKGGIFNFN